VGGGQCFIVTFGVFKRVIWQQKSRLLLDSRGKILVKSWGDLSCQKVNDYPREKRLVSLEPYRIAKTHLTEILV